jgi:hypothetical protein
MLSINSKIQEENTTQVNTAFFVAWRVGGGVVKDAVGRNRGMTDELNIYTLACVE